MTAQAHADIGGLARPKGSLNAATALLPYRGRLTHRRAAHLLRRAGFGGTPEDVRRTASMSPGEAVESLMRVPPADSLAPAQIFDRRPYLPQLRRLRGTAFKRFFHQLVREDHRSIAALRLWWLNRMLTSPAPLQEKMTLYFHGHFTSRVPFATLTYSQNQLFRRYALGNLRALTHDVSRDGAMLIYLNNNQNVASHPNENYARELMELFTLGVGNYTEQDVRESARAWTGWRMRRLTQAVVFDPALHDTGVKTFLGRSGNFGGDDIVDIIFEQPQCARFFATSLLSYFVYNDPEPELVDAVAELLRSGGYELAPVLVTIFRSNVFYSDRAYRALVKSPAELVVGTHGALGLGQIEAWAADAMARMGQVLFEPPNVAGWPGGANWLSSGTMIARQNFLARIVREHPPALTPDEIASSILQDDLAPTWRDRLRRLPDPAQAAALALSTPAYQLN